MDLLPLMKLNGQRKIISFKILLFRPDLALKAQQTLSLLSLTCRQNQPRPCWLTLLRLWNGPCFGTPPSCCGMPCGQKTDQPTASPTLLWLPFWPSSGSHPCPQALELQVSHALPPELHWLWATQPAASFLARIFLTKCMSDRSSVYDYLITALLAELWFLHLPTGFGAASQAFASNSACPSAAGAAPGLRAGLLGLDCLGGAWSNCSSLFCFCM